MKALSHPVRVKALTILTERVASPKEIAQEIDVSLGNVSYHVRKLERLGLIEMMEEEKVRGAVAHFYKAVARPMIDNPDWEKIDPAVRSTFSGYVIETLVTDATTSLAVGVFDRRQDRHLSRTPLRLDLRGWRRVSAIQAKALSEIIKEEEAAAARLAASAEEAIQAIVGMAFFEMPQR